MKQTATAKAAFLASILSKGEEYAGIILGKDGEPDYHLILLPSEAESVTWQQAKDFAKEASGELPTRREQALLFANLKEHFKAEWYWSGKQHESGSDGAWTQDFSNGGQDWDYKDYGLRARAVRRLIIQ